MLQIRVIDRVCEIPHEGPFCDLMWSDPEDIETWAVSPRGAGWLFGKKVTAEFNQINGKWRLQLSVALADSVQRQVVRRHVLFVYCIVEPCLSTD